MAKHHLVKIAPDLFARLVIMASKERRSATLQLAHILDLELPALPEPAKPGKPTMPQGLNLVEKAAWCRANPLQPGEEIGGPIRLRRDA